MKFQIPSPQQTFITIKRLIFHPMLYLAIGLHWFILQSPLPPKKVEAIPEEELVEESVTIAQAKNLKALIPPKTNRPKPPKPKPKPKPKADPVAQAIKAQITPEKPKPVPPPPPVEKPKPPEEASKPPEEEPKPPEDNAKEKKKPEEETKSADSSASEDSQADETEQDPTSNGEPEFSGDLSQFEDQENPFAGSEDEQKVSFDPGLLPIPNLVFTDESLEEYYSSPDGELEQQDYVFRVERWIQTPLERAREKLPELFPGYQANDPEEYGGGQLFQFQKDEESVFASLFQPTSRTKRSTTVFVIWKRNPQISTN